MHVVIISAGQRRFIEYLSGFNPNPGVIIYTRMYLYSIIYNINICIIILYVYICVCVTSV